MFNILTYVTFKIAINNCNKWCERKADSRSFLAHFESQLLKYLSHSQSKDPWEFVFGQMRPDRVLDDDREQQNLDRFHGKNLSTDISILAFTSGFWRVGRLREYQDLFNNFRWPRNRTRPTEKVLSIEGRNEWDYLHEAVVVCWDEAGCWRPPTSSYVKSS